MKSTVKIFVMLVLSAGVYFSGAQDRAPKNMVLVKEGEYLPLYSKDQQKIKVESFYLDIYPVTNNEFLEFVKANPKWQRSNVKKIFADKGYLHHWKGDMELGKNVNGESPVVNISWFAAKAFAEWKGKRLPSVDEWEYAASAGKDKKDGSRDPETLDRIRKWYSKLSSKNIAAVGSTEKNYWGVYDMFGLIWEWTYDFNNALVTGESRGDAGIERNLFCGSGSSNSGDSENYPAFMRYGFRSSLKANYTVSNLGFRCAKNIKN